MLGDTVLGDTVLGDTVLGDTVPADEGSAGLGFDLAAPFLADAALGLSAFWALPDFFAALPLAALAGTALADAALAGVALAGAALAGAALAAPAVERAAPFRAVPVVGFPVVGFPVVAREALVRAGVALAAVLALAVLAGVLLAVVVRAGVVLAGAAASVFAALLSEVTAVSRALVADEIAVSALVSVFADEAAWVAAAFSLVEAVVTFVAAEATVRGVTAVARAVVVRPVVVRPVVVRLAVVRAADVVPLAAPVFAAPVRAGAAVFAALVVVAVRVRELARTPFATRTGAALAVAFLVGGTDLLPRSGPVIGGVIPRRVTSYTSCPGKTAGTDQITATFRYSSPGVPGGSNSCTIRSASAGVAPRPTATPIR